MTEPTLFEMDTVRAETAEKKRKAPKPRNWFPANSTELRLRGYTFGSHSHCSSDQCNAPIEFWRTPTGKVIPIDYMENALTPAVAHWSTCTDPNRFRKAKTK